MSAPNATTSIPIRLGSSLLLLSEPHALHHVQFESRPKATDISTGILTVNQAGTTVASMRRTDCPMTEKCLNFQGKHADVLDESLDFVLIHDHATNSYSLEALSTKTVLRPVQGVEDLLAIAHDPHSTNATLPLSWMKHPVQATETPKPTKRARKSSLVFDTEELATDTPPSAQRKRRTSTRSRDTHQALRRATIAQPQHQDESVAATRTVATSASVRGALAEAPVDEAEPAHRQLQTAARVDAAAGQTALATPARADAPAEDEMEAPAPASPWREFAAADDARERDAEVAQLHGMHIDDVRDAIVPVRAAADEWEEWDALDTDAARPGERADGLEDVDDWEDTGMETVHSHSGAVDTARVDENVAGQDGNTEWESDQ